jgi:triosephosphate isomerase
MRRYVNSKNATISRMKAMVVANWKMNPPSWREAKKLFEQTKKVANKAKGCEIVVAPPSIYLRELRASYRGKKLSLAAQDGYFEAEGAHTGEVSLAQIAESGVTHVIIGHAERRAEGESNLGTRKKVAAAIELKTTPILCIGERERGKDGEHFTFIKEQLVLGFADVPQNKISRAVVAYEPVWAIGKEEAMNPREMHEMAIFIRKSIVESYGEQGLKVRILYGGSIDEKNAPAMLRDGDVGGLLVGRVSTDPIRFQSLISAISK